MVDPIPALTAWRERGDMATWLKASLARVSHACEVAASFELKSTWAFDAEPFRSAVESIGRRLPGAFCPDASNDPARLGQSSCFFESEAAPAEPSLKPCA
jgi:hypothetical protein